MHYRDITKSSKLINPQEELELSNPFEERLLDYYTEN